MQPTGHGDGDELTVGVTDGLTDAVTVVVLVGERETVALRDAVPDDVIVTVAVLVVVVELVCVSEFEGE